MRRLILPPLVTLVAAIGCPPLLWADGPPLQLSRNTSVESAPLAAEDQGGESRGVPQGHLGLQLPPQGFQPLPSGSFNRLPLRGTRVFDAHFDLNAGGPHPTNAYLATYLSTLIWPEFLWQVAGVHGLQHDPYVGNLHSNPLLFYLEFKKYTDYLFSNPVYSWVYAEHGGYDPEAMVIATGTTVLLVFRGTDPASSSRSSSGKKWAEWISTDYDFRHVDPDLPRVTGGKVHSGFWKSLQSGPANVIRNGQLGSCLGGSRNESTFRECLVSEVKAAGGHNKKVIIMGHSLGAGHSQLFAAYLAAHVDREDRPDGIRPHTVYAVGAPHVGNDQFRDKLHELVRKERIQRFDFVDDPTTSMPAYMAGPFQYGRIGLRTYYNDIKTVQVSVPERLPVLGSTIPGALVGNYCFHYPQWYLLAAWSAVPAQVKAALPMPLDQPRVGGPVYRDWCQNPLTVARGERSEAGRLADAAAAAARAAQEAAAAAAQAAEQVVYNTGQLFANLLANPIADGTYTLRLLQGRKFLDISGGCRGENGCKVQLWDIGQSAANNRFKIKKELGGYSIRNGSGDNLDFLEVDANDLLDDGGRVQMWEANLPFGGHNANQLWHFYAVPNRPKLFVVRNVATGKVMDAKNDCVNQNGCGVRQKDGKNNDPTQVWIVEPVN